MPTQHSWVFNQRRLQPQAVIHVRNLQASLAVGRDAWGREGKLQPVLISVSASLKEPFQSASDSDAVTSSTIHYGMLTKAILKFCETECGQASRKQLYLFLSNLEGSLTSSGTFNVNLLESLILGSFLPKASLIGSGVSLNVSYAYDTSEAASFNFVVLQLHDLRIPTLIGVNDVERLAKQIVVANVSVDPWFGGDIYNELEEIVVKTIEESSFQTLEALATHLSGYIFKYFLLPRGSILGLETPIAPRVWITLEKPTAITFADAPKIEVLVDSGDLLKKLKGQSAQPIKLPFPLNGRLDDWIRENDNHEVQMT